MVIEYVCRCLFTPVYRGTFHRMWHPSWRRLQFPKMFSPNFSQWTESFRRRKVLNSHLQIDYQVHRVSDHHWIDFPYCIVRVPHSLLSRLNRISRISLRRDLRCVQWCERLQLNHLKTVNNSSNRISKCMRIFIEIFYSHSVPLNGPWPWISNTNNFIFSAYLPVKFNFGNSNVKLNFIFGISALQSKYIFSALSVSKYEAALLQFFHHEFTRSVHP